MTSGGSIAGQNRPLYLSQEKYVQLKRLYWEHKVRNSFFFHHPPFSCTPDRKPGYDPVELFVDPKLNFPRLRVAYRLAQKVLGFRYLMDVIPLNAELVKGSHGLLPSTPSEGPLFITQRTDLLPSKNLQPTQVASLLRRHIEQQ